EKKRTPLKILDTLLLAFFLFGVLSFGVAGGYSAYRGLEKTTAPLSRSKGGAAMTKENPDSNRTTGQDSLSGINAMQPAKEKIDLTLQVLNTRRPPTPPNPPPKNPK